MEHRNPHSLLSVRIARQLYDCARVERPDLEWNGIGTDDSGRVYLKVGNERDADRASDWLEANRPLGVAIRVSTQAGLTDIPPRSTTECADGFGVVRTMNGLRTLLDTRLPRDFPGYSLYEERGQVALAPVRALTDRETQLVSRFGETHGTVEIVLETSTPQPIQPIKAKRDVRQHSRMPMIQSSRWVSTRYSKSLTHLVERDEDYWSANRLALSTSYEAVGRHQLPDSWRKETSRCFVDASVFKPGRLSTYLSLYEEVVIAPPIRGAEASLEALGISRSELRPLIDTGRVKLVLPQSVARYDDRLIAEVAEAHPDSIVLSRRLAALKVSEVRRRFPLVYPAFPFGQRHLVANELLNVAAALPAPQGDGLRRILQNLFSSWTHWEAAIEEGGAIGTMSCGIGRLVADLVEQSLGRDLHIEFSAASQGIETAIALKAALFPQAGEGYSEEAHCELLAALFSAPLAGAGPSAQLELTEQLLAIEDGPSTLEVARHLGGGDIDRFRRGVSDLMSRTVPEDWPGVVASYNAAITQFERAAKCHSRWDITGPRFSSIAAGLAIGGLVAGPFGGLSGAIAGYIASQLVRRLDDAKTTQPILGSVSDLLKGVLAGASPQTILLSRIRRGGVPAPPNPAVDRSQAAP